MKSLLESGANQSAPPRDSVSNRPAIDASFPAPVPEVFPGLLGAGEFDGLATGYRKATGHELLAVDLEGRLLRGRKERRTCSDADACRRHHAQAIAEALRWGEPSVMCCACGRAVWAVPVMRNQQVCGGLIVTGVSLHAPRNAGSLDRRILRSCRLLLDLAAEHNLTNAAHLAQRRQVASHEREKAEALHELKNRLYDDIRSTYLHEEPALLAAIHRGDRHEARRILNRVLVAIYAVGRSHTALLKSLALELIVVMTRAAVQAGGNPQDILGLNFQSLTTLARVPDQEGLAAWLCRTLEQLIDSIEANTRRPNSVQLARAVEYMQEHLAEALSREDVAQAAGLSPSHFSHLMRAKTGWSFTGLLTRLRIDHACHLLAHTGMDLAQIALTCGFGDQSYFGRVFRRRVGRPPGEYRRTSRDAAPKS